MLNLKLKLKLIKLFSVYVSNKLAESDGFHPVRFKVTIRKKIQIKIERDLKSNLAVAAASTVAVVAVWRLGIGN